MREPIHLVFFHGLNTFGDADVHVGPLRFGSMAKHWEAALAKLHPQIQFHTLNPLGFESLADQTARASRDIGNMLTQLDSTFEKQVAAPKPVAAGAKDFSDARKPMLHFIAQSTGGLTARMVAAQDSFRDRVKSIITVGTPHHGSAAAEFALKTASSDSSFARLLKPAAKAIGYDVDRKTRIFRELTRASLLEFNARYPAQASTPCFSIPCSIERSKIAWPLQFLYSWIHQEMPAPSDGFISLASQILSPEINASLDFPLENLALDHYSELGYCLAPHSLDRAQAVKEFDRLIEVVVRIVSSRNDSPSYR